MAYTVISVFPPATDTEEVKSQLRGEGFSEDNIIVSKSKIDDDSGNDFEDDENTKHFWDHMFASDTEMLDAYSRKSRGNTTIVLYTNSYDEAQRAKSILDGKGAIEIIKQREGETVRKNVASDIPEDVERGIIAKAKHNLYFLGSDRVYHSNVIKGMDDPMDDAGAKD
ncbi:hypothetical protein ASG31_03585 [Chryseobacterium sp. Leaf404]|uniref:hypothetical protein n=1 Tax=unclassified Chryseobacterium TaxID=2593645 RepID=UPI0006F2A3BE|nr:MULTISPECIES: hypothetical protein [unclassified Chryseobacterium]KQT22417.1 hypothetical protein ASG31_03585 [Chryseobacterium sp. Leaf404]